MKNFQWIGYLCIYLLAANILAFADSVKLTDGDLLKGTIIQLKDSKLSLKTSYAGVVEIDWKAVQSIESEGNFLINIGEKDRVNAQLAADTPGQAALISPVLGAMHVALEKIISISPPDHPLAESELQAAQATIQSMTQELQKSQQEVDKLKDKTDLGKLWSGSVAMLGSMRAGNREAYDFFVKTEAKRITEQEQFTLRGDVGYGETEGVVDTTEGSFNSNLRVFYSEPGYIFGDLLLEHDRFEELDLRVDGTVGAGYRFWKSPRSEFMGDLGVGVSEEVYKESDNSTQGNLRVGVEFMQMFFEKTKLTQLLTIYPSMSELGDFRLISETTFLVPLTDSLSWNVNISEKFDNNPGASDVEENDVSIRSGLQYSF